MGKNKKIFFLKKSSKFLVISSLICLYKVPLKLSALIVFSNSIMFINTKELKIYLSGSKEFIKESSKLFKENKIHTNKIHFEACY